jgi:hypothetical protein
MTLPQRRGTLPIIAPVAASSKPPRSLKAERAVRIDRAWTVLERLDVAQTLADQSGLKVGHSGRGRLVGAARIRLADAVDALVGLDPYEQVVAPVQTDEGRLATGDLYDTPRRQE